MPLPKPSFSRSCHATVVAILLVSTCVLGCQFPKGSHRILGLRKTKVIERSPNPTYSTFASQGYDFRQIGRVAIVSSGPNHGSFNENQKMIAELANYLRAESMFEVVAPRDLRLKNIPDNILNGRFDEMEIAELSRRYNVDAIAIVRVNDLRTTAPCRTSVTVSVVDSNQSTVICGLDGVWDLSDPQIETQFAKFVGSGNSPDAAKIYQKSPSRMLSFAAQQIAGSLSQYMR